MLYNATMLMQTKCLMKYSKYYSKNMQMCFLKQTRGQTWQEEEKIHSQNLPKSI